MNALKPTPRNASKSLRARILGLAWELLSQVEPPAGAVTVTIEAAGQRHVLTAEPGEIGRPAAASLTPRQRKLLAALTLHPQTMPAIARKAGYRPGNHVYADLTELARLGKAEKAPGGGYRLAGPIQIRLEVNDGNP